MKDNTANLRWLLSMLTQLSLSKKGSHRGTLSAMVTFLQMEQRPRHIGLAMSTCYEYRGIVTMMDT